MTQQQDVAIYCVCFPGHEPFRQQVYQKNIMCNATILDSVYRAQLKSRNYIFDDEGENISTLNPTLGDLTATYWIWKNSSHKIVGTSQYRRFWDKAELDRNWDENTLYVQEPISLEGKNLKQQYIQCHGEAGLSVLEDLAFQQKIPLTVKMIEKAYAMKSIYGCNMFIAHKPLYDQFCNLLFKTVFSVYEKLQGSLEEMGNYNKRTPAFVGERVVNILIANREHFFPDIKIQPMRWKLLKKPLLNRIFKK